MRVIIEELQQGEEEVILIKCKEIDDSLMKLINGFRQGNLRIAANKSNHIFRLDPKDIFYIESVDNKIFIYDSTEVYETKMKLYELEKELYESDFIRASKSTILNLSKIKSLAPAFSGRLEASLKNGEKVIISRQYVGKLKERLGI